MGRRRCSALASNGYGSHSPGGFELGAVIIAEIVFTALFVLVIVEHQPQVDVPGFTGAPVGLMLALDAPHHASRSTTRR